MSDLESRGLPTVYVATSEFVSGADAQAKSLGFQHSPVYVAHPVQDRTDEEMRAMGDAAVEQVLAGILRQAPQRIA